MLDRYARMDGPIVLSLWKRSTLRHARLGPGTSLLQLLAMSERLGSDACDACAGREAGVSFGTIETAAPDDERAFHSGA